MTTEKDNTDCMDTRSSIKLSLPMCSY